ncbi:HalOD1 output domain-containing protein [Natronolimnohabitans innermongolicus]|uniref:Halobacterial output domain-containing protein n=1 Tax=Natronolimnohabitans innermongolicus JCM 12255 TaxID=1227499 RepID=L9XBZ8_9EURY|nr:HalOD1 output domain-containing protein [Natronolimnohabitans innermongolicus]ELY58956.1 hypothetical protein C493_05905 [Natronolimnohabitans innermongolicus JCM 12255]
MSDANFAPSLSDQPTSLAVVERVADLEGTDPLSLPPLYDAIDPEALDSISQSTAGGTQTGAAVRFTYCGYDVRVGDDGAIDVSETCSSH